MIAHKDITDFFHSKTATALMMAALAVCCFVALAKGAIVPITGGRSLGLPMASTWFAPQIMSAAASLVMVAMTVLLLVAINRWFNIMRRITAFVPTAFLMLELAQPSVTSQFFGGTLLMVVMPLAAIILFSVYADSRGCQRSVFLVFLLIGLSAFFQFGFVFYFPFLIIALMQLRLLNLRSILAALMGFITPAWILIGFGIVPLSELRWPGMQPAWSMFDSTELVHAVVTTAVTALVGICFTVANLMKILSYNARVRSMNGVLTMLFVYTVVLAIIDFNNFMFYVPLLNCTAAYQIGHFFSYHRHQRSYIAILAMLTGCIGFYAWALVA